MKTALIVVVLLISSSALAGDVSVRGYWRDSNHDGVKDTYVEPYHRTSPDHTKSNNYGTYPNENPYSGKEGTRSPHPNAFDSGKPKSGLQW